jgi:hypothetical protein
MKKIVLTCCILFATFGLQGQILNVPADYSTIQKGINAANPGDTVLVADGIYSERLNFMGKKPLVVASQYIIDGNEDHIDSTIIDGSQFPYSNKSVVNFVLGEDTTSVLCGFTIRQGGGTVYEADGYTFKAGGGIFISGSGAKIIHNHITENNLSYNMLSDSVDIFDGSAISTEWKPDQNWVVIENNVIDHNSCMSANFQAGSSGICIYCNARIAYNTITDNICTGLENSSALAGGICCATDPAWDNTVTAIVNDNVITNNIVQAENNYAFGAGVFFQHVTGFFQDNIVQNNQLITFPGGGGGGGLDFYMPLDGSVISGNMFMDNSSTLWAGALCLETDMGEMLSGRILLENNYFTNNHAVKGGAIAIFSVPVNCQNNVFSGNIADQRGGAMHVWKSFPLPVHHMLKLVNNSFYNNIAETGGAVYSIHGKPLVFNSIFSNNNAEIGPEFYIPYPTDTLEIAYSNLDMTRVYGRINDGGNNINEDPLFKDPLVLTLELESPCLDAGTASYTCDCNVQHNCPLYDIDLVPRESGLVDMGAHEILSTAGLPQITGNVAFASVKVYPNPASDKTNFEYDLFVPCHIRLSVYNLLGREIALLADDFQYKGRHKIVWDIGFKQPGPYYYRLVKTDNYQVITGKILIVK